MGWFTILPGDYKVRLYGNSPMATIEISHLK